VAGKRGEAEMPTRQLACVSGRFQPLHRQHVELFALALQEAEQLIVAITNPDAGTRHPVPASSHRHRPHANPFSYFERYRFVAAALRQHGWLERSAIVPLDLGAPTHWAEYVPLTACQWVRVYTPWEAEKARLLQAGGYTVRVLQGDAGARVSGSSIRSRLLAGAPWEADVPEAVVPLLRACRARVLAAAAQGPVL